MRKTRGQSDLFVRSVGGFIRRFIQDEDGQAITEYVLILFVAVTGAAALLRGLMSVIDSGILRIGGQLEKDLKTGRAPLSVWRN